ncbi:hypothetical protein BH10PSE6_BH10PSE6_29980 [soil metagenome]
MRRLLKGRTWRIRGNNAAEASMGVAVAAIVLPLLLFAGASWIAYGETRREAEERMARTLDLVYGNVRTIFEMQSLVISNTREILDEYPSPSAIRANEEKVHAKLRRLVVGLPQIQGIWVLDAEARPLASANLHPVPRDLVASDRSYFVAHRDGARRHVSEVLHGRALANEFFQYSERRDRPDGSFDGLMGGPAPLDRLLFCSRGFSSSAYADLCVPQRASFFASLFGGLTYCVKEPGTQAISALMTSITNEDRVSRTPGNSRRVSIANSLNRGMSGTSTCSKKSISPLSA